MSIKKVFTYVSPKSNQEVAECLCTQLPIILRPVNTVEELYPLLSDPCYYTDFVCISIDMFQQRHDGLDMFDIVHTLSTLIKSTVYRTFGSGKTQRRDTKIFVVVDYDTDTKLVKEVMNFPDIAFVGWVLSRPEDYQSVLEFTEQIISGNFQHHPKVLELIKPKKKAVDKNKDVITLTPRQSQVLHLVQDRGASNKTIARMLSLSESTVKLHMSAIFKKYGVKNRTQLAVFARDQLKSTIT